ncbi:hypothetical protein HWV07_16405 [Natronomonas salina]|uniref:hypothetical protein n=1 Tax=Natronomonas salina TaxID=1710540 RepID=UPI0015B6F5CB|nr:hypothetical protein [Natronomonas salina]QLD90531.1 hypothetical protein HWV07_16405 [Natronomonas salina]
MSSTAHSSDRSAAPKTATGIVDVSEMTVDELRRFVGSSRGLEGEVSIQRRGQDAFLLTE